MSKIRLHGSSSGYMEIAPPAAGSSATITLPNSAGEVLLSDGSAASLTQIPAANIVGVATAGFGNGILQVVQTTKVDTQSIQSQTFTDISGMSVTITPTSASSKILVMFSISVATSSYGMINLVRGSTDIFKGNSTGSRVNCTVAAITQNSYECETYSHTFLDSPNTTSATTYKLQVALPHNASYTMYVNRVGSNDTDANYVPRPVSSITVLEVAA